MQHFSFQGVISEAVQVVTTVGEIGKVMEVGGGVPLVVSYRTNNNPKHNYTLKCWPWVPCMMLKAAEAFEMTHTVFLDNLAHTKTQCKQE